MFAPQIEELRSRLDVLVEEDLGGVGNLRLDQETAELGRLVTVLEAEALRRAGEWERRRLWMLDGSRSARACLARRWGATVGAAGERLLLAARLREGARHPCRVRSGRPLLRQGSGPVHGCGRGPARGREGGVP